MERTNGLHQQVLVRLYFPCNAAGSTVRFRKYVDMVEKGIIDPAKVTRSALQNEHP